MHVLAIVLSSSLAAVAAEPARSVYYNGKIFTAAGAQPWVQGLAVEGDRIVAAGTNAQALAQAKAGTTLVDLHGQTVIPGFNDAHVHTYDSTVFPRAANLNHPGDFVPGPGPTLQDVQALLRQGAAKNPPGTWLFVTIGANVVQDPAVDRFALDSAAPNHPVLLSAWYGHGTYLNSKAIQVMGLSEDEPDPFGGFYDRVPGTNVLNGVAHEYAEHLVRRYFATQMTDAELQSLYEGFAAAAARAGYTSLQEFSIGVPQERHLRVLSKASLAVRWRAICLPLDLNESCAIPQGFAQTSRLTASGIKWVADGTYIERGAFQEQDYADATGVRGHLNFPPDTIRTELKRSVAGNPILAQPLFHSVGEGTSDTILDEMNAIASDGHWTERRPRIEHGTLLRPSRYQSARDKGVFVVQNPLHFSLAPLADVRFSPGLLADIDPMKSLLQAGIRLALGSDSLGAPGNPYLDLFFALTQPTHPAEALTMEEAVIAYTRTAAEAEFQEQNKGTLEAGKLADFLVLSADIFSLPKDHPELVLSAHPILTVVGGKAVFDDGSLVRSNQ